MRDTNLWLVQEGHEVAINLSFRSIFVADVGIDGVGQWEQPLFLNRLREVFVC